LPKHTSNHWSMDIYGYICKYSQKGLIIKLFTCRERFTSYNPTNYMKGRHGVSWDVGKADYKVESRKSELKYESSLIVSPFQMHACPFTRKRLK
jgi:hypothetical protein